MFRRYDPVPGTGGDQYAFVGYFARMGQQRVNLECSLLRTYEKSQSFFMP